MDDAEFQTLLNAAPPVILAGNKYEDIVWALFFIVLALLFSVFVIANNTISPGMWVFALLSAIFGIRVFFWPQYAYPPQLVLDKEGFAVKTTWPVSAKPGALKRVRPGHIGWETVSEFRPRCGGGVPSRVWYDDITKVNPSSFHRQRFGGDYHLGNNYGLTINQLAQLMNHWRERAIGANK